MTNKVAIPLGTSSIKTHYSDAEACVYIRADDVINFLRTSAAKSLELSKKLPPTQSQQAISVAETLAVFSETFDSVKKDVIEKRSSLN